MSTVEAAGAAAASSGLKTVGLLGTRFTMEGEFYPRVFARHGITIAIPEGEDRAYVHERYLGELTRGVFQASTRRGMVAVIERLREQANIEGVILGGTELPLLFREGPPLDVPLLDTTLLHVDRVLDRLLVSSGC